MAYEEPGIKVIQQLQAQAVNVQGATQSLVLVGELYEIFDDQAHDDGYDPVTGAGDQTFVWPGKKTTSIVDLAGVRESIAEVDSQLNEAAPYALAWALRDPSSNQVFELDPLTDVYAIDQDGFKIVEGVDAATARAAGDNATAAKDAEFHLSAGGLISAGVVPGDRIRMTNGTFDVRGTVVTAYDDHVFYTADGHNMTVKTATSAYATGYIKAIAGSLMVDGETFILDDGVNPAVTYEFDDNASVVETGTLRAVTFTGTETAAEMRDLILAAITGTPLLAITPTPTGTDTITLTNDAYGVAGNVAIVETVADTSFIVSGMSGGTGDTTLVATVTDDPVALRSTGRLLIGSGLTTELIDYTALSVSGSDHTFTVDAMTFAHAVGENVSVQVVDTPSVSVTDGDLVTASGYITSATGGFSGKEGARAAIWVENLQVNDGGLAATGVTFSSATLGLTYADVGKKISIWSDDPTDGAQADTDGDLNTTPGKLTTTNGAFTSADVGKVILIAGEYRRITAIDQPNTPGIITYSGTTLTGTGVSWTKFGQVVRTIMSVSSTSFTVDGTDITGPQSAVPLVLHRAVYRDLVTDSANDDFTVLYSGSAISSDTGWLYHVPVEVFDDDLTYEIFPAYELLVTYRALDVSSVNQELGVYTSTDISALATVSKDNPLLWAAQAALVAMGTTDTLIYLLPVNLYQEGDETGYPADRSEAQGYLDALEILERNENAYFLVPLTRNATVRDAFASHVNALSDPCEKYERICYLTYALPMGLLESTTGQIAPGLDGGNKVLSDPGQNFLSEYQIIAGNKVVITAPAAFAGEYTVASGSTEDELVLEGDDWTQTAEFTATDADTTTGGEVISSTANVWKDVEVGDYLLHDGETRRITAISANGTLPYAKLTYEGLDLSTLAAAQTVSILRTHVTVEYYARPYDKATQASTLAGISTSRGDRRVVHMWPDEVEMVTGTDSAGNDVEEMVSSIYAAAAEAGRDAVIPPQRSSTGMDLGGFTALEHSNFYFKKSQLNTIAAGGWAILHQPTRGGSVKMRHLLTTDMSTVKTQEVAFTKNVDNMAKRKRTSMEPLLNDDKGRINITKQFLSALAAPIQGIYETFVRDEQIVATEDAPPYNVLSLTQDTTQPDNILETTELNVPLPANRVVVTFVI